MDKEVWIDRFIKTIGRVENNDEVFEFITNELRRAREETRNECIEKMWQVSCEDDFS